MIFLLIITAGVLATLVMTGLYMVSWVTGKPLKVIKILGTMLSSQTTPTGEPSGKPSAILTGIVAHYLIGIGFAWTFYLLWRQEIVRFTPGDGLWFGFWAGVVGIIIWRIFFALHPRPPRQVPLGWYLPTLLVAHVLFGLVLVWIYQRFPFT